MIFKRFFDSKLAQASYLVGCPSTKEALIIDPNRSIDQYLRAAAEEKLRIAHVTETHIHADFVSGTRELAQRTGARLYLSGAGGRDWQYEYGRDAGATLLHDGSRFAVGEVRVQVLHTPGHTPEHLTFLVTDSAAASEPMGAVTGDFLFVGDVGRPDRCAARGRGGSPAFRFAPAIPSSPRVPPDLAGPRGWIGVWQGVGSSTPVDPRLRDALQLGVRHLG